MLSHPPYIIVVLTIKRGEATQSRRGIIMGKKVTAKVKKAEVKAPVQAEPPVEERNPIQTYNWTIKGSEKDKNAIILLENGKKVAYNIGDKKEHSLEDLAMPVPIRKVFSGILTGNKIPDSLQLSLKKGYGYNQFGFTRKQLSWRGVFTFTDKELCTHTWKGKYGINELRDLAKKHELVESRHDVNWITWTTRDNNADKYIAFFQDLAKIV